MPIDRKRVKQLAEQPAAEPEPEAKADAKPDTPTRLLREVHKLVLRMQAGGDVDQGWTKLNPKLARLIKEAGKVVRTLNVPWYEAHSSSPTATAEAREIAKVLAKARDLATALEHPPDAALTDSGRYVAVRQRRIEIVPDAGGFLVKLDGAPECWFDEADEAREFARALPYNRAGEGEPEGTRWTRLTRWGKLCEVIAIWV